jgi:[lysine-biosynthesis-protein LysW]--L-2-aminoadipate ligase
VSDPSASRPVITVVHDRLREEERLLFAAFERVGATVERIYAPAWRWEAGARRHAGQVVLLRTLSHARTAALARLLEADGARVVDAASVIETCGDKAATSAALAAAGVPQPRTVVAFGGDEVLAACDDLGWPVVIKPVIGSWGRMVARCRDVDAVEALLEHKQVLGGPSHQVFYLQEHVDKPGRDLRAFVVGDRVVAAIAREGDDWRTNTARGAVVRGVPVDDALRDTALGAARAVGGGVLAVDLLESDRGLLVSEVNHGMEFRNSIAPTGVDIAAEIAAYVVALANDEPADVPAAGRPHPAARTAVS